MNEKPELKQLHIQKNISNGAYYKRKQHKVECIEADLAIDAFLHSISENQHIKGLIKDPHHHGLRV